MDYVPITELIRLLYYLLKEMKVERNRVGNKYTFTPEDKEDEKFLDKVNKKIDELEKENKKLKEDNRFLTKISKEYMKKENIIEVTEFTELYKDDLEENRTLKKELMLTENDRDEWKLKAENLWEENKELKEKLEEADKNVVLKKLGIENFNL